VQGLITRNRFGLRNFDCVSKYHGKKACILDV
jgi:hypothetical protein